MTSPATLSNPSSVGLPDILDPSDTIFHLNQLKQNLYSFLRTVENDLSADEAVQQSKIVADSLGAFKDEALLLPVVKETREFQKQRVAQLLNEIKLKNDFYNNLIAKRPAVKSKNNVNEKKKTNNWVQETVLKAKRKRQIDIFQGRLMKAPKTSEDERDDGIEYSIVSREKVVFNKNTKLPRIWRLKKERDDVRIKEVQESGDKIAPVGNIESTEPVPGPSNVPKKDTAPENLPIKSAAEIYETELAPFFEKLKSKTSSDPRYARLAKLRQALLLHREQYLNEGAKESAEDISLKRRKISDHDVNIGREEVIRTTSKKWKYYRPTIPKTTQVAEKYIPEIEEDSLPKQGFPTLTNTQIKLMRNMKVIDASEAPEKPKFLPGKTIQKQDQRIPRLKLDGSSVDPDLASVFKDMDLF